MRLVLPLFALVLLSPSVPASLHDEICDPSGPLGGCRELSFRFVDGSVSWTPVEPGVVALLYPYQMGLAVNDPTTYHALQPYLDLAPASSFDWEREWAAIMHTGPRHQTYIPYVVRVKFHEATELHEVRWSYEKAIPSPGMGIAVYAVERVDDTAKAVFCLQPHRFHHTDLFPDGNCEFRRPIVT